MTVYGAEASADRIAPLRAGDPTAVGGFRLLGRLGAGGFGTVYLGRSAAGRLVAVKVVHADIARDQGFRARFGREITVVRQVGGFYTAPLVAADADGDPPWLATAYVPGPTLAEIVRTTGPLPEPALWWLAAGIAEALVGIHAAGVTHRDLKPGNVLVAHDGPRVIDFGIARTVDPAGLTVSRTVIGTPAFLPPEQARDMRAAGPPADVYALGATLAYAGTGRPPYPGDDLMAVLARLVSGEPPDLDGLPPRLDGLVRSCLAHDPGRRPTPAGVLDSVRAHLDPGLLDPSADVLPDTAVELIDDHTAALAAVLETRPADRGRRRRPLLLAAAGVVLAVTAGALGVPALRDREDRASPAPTGSAGASSGSLSGSPAGSPPGSSSGAAASTGGGADPRPVEAVKVSIAATESTTAGAEDGFGLGFAPDGRSLATGEVSGSVVLRSPGEGTPVGALSLFSPGFVAAVAYGPVGNVLAAVDEKGTLSLWDVTRPASPQGLWNRPGEPAARLAFGPAGDLLAVAGTDGVTRLYTVTKDGARPYRNLTSLPVGEPYDPALAFAPDGRLATTGPDGELHVWDTRTGRELAGWPERVPRLLYDAAFTPDGRLLVTLEGVAGRGEGMMARLWDADGTQVRTLPVPVGAKGARLAVSPDGRLVAATGGPASVAAWLFSTATGKRLAEVRSPSGLVQALAFSPHGRTLATVHGDGAMRMWTLTVR